MEGGLAGLAAENLQARVRGVLLMALSNTYGWLVVSTGNKSELAVGYSTLYGDMVGGFALLKDVFKTDVYRLAEHLNARAGRDVIPRSTIERAPSAELRDDQRDADSIPPYDVLDPVLEAYVEEDRSREELAEEFDPAVVERAVALVDRAEYKRRQAPPGVKLRPKAFGRRPQDADHQPLPRLSSFTSSRSARTSAGARPGHGRAFAGRASRGASVDAHRPELARTRRPAARRSPGAAGTSASPLT